MPGSSRCFATLRAWLAALAAGLLLALPACTGPGLEPPGDGARGETRDGGFGNVGKGDGGTDSAPGGGVGASGNGGSPSGTGGGGGSVADPVDAGLDAGDGGLDEDGGALR